MPFCVQGLQDVIVVVTRWYGGIHLSSDRFKDINYVRGRGCLFLQSLRFHACADIIMLCVALQVARAALEQGGFLDEAEDGKKGGSGGGKGGKGGGGNANKAKKR